VKNIKLYKLYIHNQMEYTRVTFSASPSMRYSTWKLSDCGRNSIQTASARPQWQSLQSREAVIKIQVNTKHELLD